MVTTKDTMDNDEKLATALGWSFSPAHGGWINEAHRNRPGEDPNGYGSYEVADDIDEALFWSGIEADEDMRSAIDRVESGLPYHGRA